MVFDDILFILDVMLYLLIDKEQCWWIFLIDVFIVSSIGIEIGLLILKCCHISIFNRYKWFSLYDIMLDECSCKTCKIECCVHKEIRKCSVIKIFGIYCLFILIWMSYLLIYLCYNKVLLIDASLFNWILILRCIILMILYIKGFYDLYIWLLYRKSKIHSKYRSFLALYAVILMILIQYIEIIISIKAQL